MSFATALVFPAVVFQSVSGKSICCGTPRQAVAGEGSSAARVASRASLKCSQTQISSPLFGIRVFAGGSTPSRQDDVSSRASPPSSPSPSSGNAGPEVLPAPNPLEGNSEAFFSRDQSLEAPSPYPQGDGDGAPLLPPVELGIQQGNENENSLPMERIVAAVARQQSKTTEEVVSGGDPSVPTMQDIIATAAQEGIKLQVKSFGPTFQILVTSLDETQVFGKADGWIKWWWPKGKILHLESVKLERGLSKQVGNIFGAGFFVGASTLRYGLDQGCRTAELLAIYDDEGSHAKLVKYYTRLGFKTLYDVDEEDLKYLPDRVIWGGVGTRMDADTEELLRKWCVVLKPKTKSGSRKTKGFSSRAKVAQ